MRTGDRSSKLGNFVWSIADQLRGVYKPHQYGGVILPFTILRRLDCVLEPTRDEVRKLAAKYSDGALDVQVKRKTGLGFYNTSAFDFTRLLEDPEGLRANLMDFITGFSANIDVFERFKFDNELASLDEKNRLYLVTSKFAEVDLHPDTVPNAEMGDLLEHLIYKFAEASNEEAGEHYTPRDAIRLMVDLLLDRLGYRNDRNNVAGQAHDGLEVTAVHEVVESRRQQIQALCRELSVRRLDVFGSAVSDAFDTETSDVDVLVEFEAATDFDRYFALKEGLEKILGRPVDVVTITGLTNPYFRQRVMQTRQMIYAA